MNEARVHTAQSQLIGSLDPTQADAQALLAHCEHLVHENESLADEVLRMYEQINLIFDVTAQVAVLTDPYQLKRLLCERLRVSLNAQEVWLIDGAREQAEFIHQEPGNGTTGEVPADLKAEMRSLAANVREESRVLVETVGAGRSQPPEKKTYLMAGPLREHEGNTPLVMCAIRCHKEFHSGEMLLFDSVLAYGGHVLRNLNLVERLKRTSLETVRALVSAIDKKDPYTCGHSERVGILARMTGQEMGLPPEILQELEWAGLLHDIGKIGIPETILSKPGPLTKEEYAIIKRHPQMSYEVLRPIGALTGVMRTVIEHHENFDGTGYPHGLRGEEISLAGRIMHVVDVFDALTSDRAYRRPYDAQKALGILKQDAGTKLDPAVVGSFAKVLDLIERLRPAEFTEIFPKTCKEEAS